MDNILQQIVTEYKKSRIQSEEEVRSKLIVPLLDTLGYPSQLRAEHFPVYEFEGRKPQRPKEADYILFKEDNFANNREFKQDNLDWVYSNSLLVVEAKKPGEMPDVLGQPCFYTVWTRAVAYLIIDGIMIKGYFYNPINQDPQLLECFIDDLPENNDIWNFSYENIIRIKNESKALLNKIIDDNVEIDLIEGASRENDLILVNGETSKDLTEKDIEKIPESTFQYMRNALGRNADGLDKIQLISRFLNTTDALLQNNLRYDIPKYIYDFPRGIFRASIYINNLIVPSDKGEISAFYWEDNERLFYESKYLQIEIIYKNKKLIDFNIGFHVLDKRVVKRLNSFEMVRKVLYANNLKIEIANKEHRSLNLQIKSQEKMWQNRIIQRSLCEFWCNYLEEMRVIEEFYDITFKLEIVCGEDKLNDLYNSISFVYDGILLHENCELILPGGISDENINIEEPILFEDDKEIPLPKRIIHNVCFVPYQSWLIPGEIPMKGTTKNDKIRVPASCRYKIIFAEG